MNYKISEFRQMQMQMQNVRFYKITPATCVTYSTITTIIL